MDYLIFTSIGYFVGSLPFGLIIGRLTNKIDVRRYGSGSTGMTNVWRTVGWPAASVVLILDMSKSMFVISIATIFSTSPNVVVMAAMSALVGHIWPIFCRFKGGKGTATGWGGLLILSPISGIVGGMIGISTAIFTRWVSLGSLIGAATGGMIFVILSLVNKDPVPYIFYGIAAPTLIFIMHRDNIGRLLRGKERKIGQPATEVHTR